MAIEQILAIETSCDDTSIAVVQKDGYVVTCLSANQDLAHKPFGGVVPEIASRNHTLQVLPLIEEVFSRSNLSWNDIDGIVVTARPGLIGSLLVGVVTAKTLALLLKKPFLGVNHLEGHLLAPFLYDKELNKPESFAYPYLALAISGGHTQLYHVQNIGEYTVLGHTMDDAAGEAFDKFAKMVGLDFPGGPRVDKHAQNGRVDAFHFPRTMQDKTNLNFSFSGLKAAAQRAVETMNPKEISQNLSDLCASFQEAVVDSLLYKLNLAQAQYKLTRIVLTGGVSANSRLRRKTQEWAQGKSLQLIIPPLRYCTDNAAMIGYAGILRLRRGETSDQALAPSAQSLSADFRGI